MATICGYCGTPNTADARFCSSCRKLIAPGTPGAVAAPGGGQHWLGDDWFATLPPDPTTPVPAPPPWPPYVPPAAPLPPDHGQQWPQAGQQDYPSAPQYPAQPPYAQAPYPPQPYPHSYPTVPYPPPQNGQPQGYYVPPASGPYPPQAAAQVPLYAAPYGALGDYPYGQPYSPPYGTIVQAPRASAAVSTVVPGSAADFWPRFGALMVDYCLLFVLWFTLLGISAFAGGTALALLATFLGPGAYFVGFWSTTGRTPGYRAAGLQLIRTDGTKPGLGPAVVRYLGSLLSWSFFCLGYLWMLWDRDRQTWHDKIAGTRVINLR